MSNNTIEGIWYSTYEYGRGPNDEPQTSEHQIQLTREDGEWKGVSLPSEDGSEVELRLSQEGEEFSGTWHERTSPDGHYRGREFKGPILLLLDQEGNTLDGMWLGAGSSSGRVKAGKWTLKREEGQEEAV